MQMEISRKFPECVLCMGVNNTLINIFEVNDTYSYVAAAVIAELLQFEVPESDCYPNSICVECLEKLSDFREFRKTCLGSKDILEKKYLSKQQIELLVTKQKPKEDHGIEEDFSDVELLVPKQELIEVRGDEEDEGNQENSGGVSGVELLVPKRETEYELGSVAEEILNIQKQEIDIDDYDPWGNRFSKKDASSNEDGGVSSKTGMVIEEVKEQIEIIENPISFGSSDEQKISPSLIVDKMRRRKSRKEKRACVSNEFNSSAKFEEDRVAEEEIIVQEIPLPKQKPKDIGIRVSRNLYSPSQASTQQHNTGSVGGGETVLPSTSHHGVHSNRSYSKNQGRSWENYDWSMHNPYDVGNAAKQTVVPSVSHHEIRTNRDYNESPSHSNWNHYNWPSQIAYPVEVALPDATVPDGIFNDNNSTGNYSRNQVRNWSTYDTPTQVLVSPSRHSSQVGRLEPENRSLMAEHMRQNAVPYNTSQGTCGESTSSSGTCDENMYQSTDPSKNIREADPVIVRSVLGYNITGEQVPSDKSPEEVRGHSYNVTIIPPPTEDTDLERSATSRKKNKRKMTPYICDICGFTTVWKHTLIHHVRIHSGERPHKCSMCPKSFSRLYNLKIHEKNHLGERNFCCGTCSKKFITQSHLRLHEKIHKQEWACMCEVCGKGFVSASHLQKHKVKHTGVKPFHCDHCNRSYAYESGFKAHLNNHAELMRRYYCGKCKRSYARQYSLKIHVCKA